MQVNFADDVIDIPCPGEMREGIQERYIDGAPLRTQWKLEASEDGERWFVVEDKTDADTDLSHDLVLREEGFRARWLRLSGMAVPYGQNPCVSGLRAFGLGDGAKPAAPAFTVRREGDLDMVVNIAPQADAAGYNVLFGASPDKLYHSWLTFAPGELRVGALVKGRRCFVRVDAWNESGITHGPCVPLD